MIGGTTLLKFAIGTLGLTTLWAGVGAGLNYAASFVLIMLLHWTVATKQPAMTAPAMAEALAKVRPGNDNAAEIEAFVDASPSWCARRRSASWANVALCFPVVLAAQWLPRWIGWRAAGGQRVGPLRAARPRSARRLAALCGLHRRAAVRQLAGGRLGRERLRLPPPGQRAALDTRASSAGSAPSAPRVGPHGGAATSRVWRAMCRSG
jgi:hypothetical protein